MRISDFSSDVCSSDLLICRDELPQPSFRSFRDETFHDFNALKQRSLFQFITDYPGFYLLVFVHDMEFVKHLVVVIRYAVQDRKSVVSGKRVSGRVDFGGRSIVKTKKNTQHTKK